MRKEKVQLIDSVICDINSYLERGDWTIQEAESGRIIEVQKKWSPVIKYVLSEYENTGWNVSRHAQISSSKKKIFHYLKFINPNYLQSPKEIRETGVRANRRKVK